MLRNPQSRTEEITAPRRVEPLGEPAYGDRAQQAMDMLGDHYDSDRPEVDPGDDCDDFFATVSHSPEIFASYVQFGRDLALESTLDARVRELAILRTAWLCGAPYQWGEHVLIARQAGISQEEIDRIAQEKVAADWSPREQALLRAVDELHRDAMISDASWTALASHLDDRQLVELTLLVGHYHTTAFVQNALRVRLIPGNPGLTAR